MSKCLKVKNPCKICKTSVSPRSGLQCQGACQNWVHYKCLNYTPGKVSDIKNGVIKVLCPCPDCKALEIRTDEPYECISAECPINNKCDKKECPGNVKPPKCKTLRGIKCGTDECVKYSVKSAANGRCSPTPSQESCKIKSPCISPCPSEIRVPKCESDTKRPKKSGRTQQCVIEELSKTLNRLAEQVGELIKCQKTSSCSSTNSPCPPPKPQKKKKKFAPVPSPPQQYSAGAPPCKQPCHCPSNPKKKRTSQNC